MALIIPILMLLGSLVRLVTHILAVDTGRRGRKVLATITKVNRTIIHRRPSVGSKVRSDYILTMEFEGEDGRGVCIKPIVAGYVRSSGGRLIPQWAPGDQIAIRHHRRFVSIIRVEEGVREQRALPIAVWGVATLCLTVLLVHLAGA